MASIACKSNAQQQKGSAPPPPTVEITTVTPQDTPIFAEYPAQTYARDLVEVRARVDGYIEKWLFKPGQQVQAGQPLYILDLRPYRAQVQQAQGSVRQAEADLYFAKQQVSLLQAEANLEAAKANLIKAQQDFNRLKPLVEAGCRRPAGSGCRYCELCVPPRRMFGRTKLMSKQATARTPIRKSSRPKVELQQQRGALDNGESEPRYGTVRLADQRACRRHPGSGRRAGDRQFRLSR